MAMDKYHRPQIVLLVRYWNKNFPKTLYSYRLYVDSEKVREVEAVEGNDSSAKEDARNWLADNEYLHGIFDCQTLFMYCHEEGVPLIEDVAVVERKKQLYY